jgi:hypothetical protein
MKKVIMTVIVLLILMKRTELLEVSIAVDQKKY